MTLVVQEQDSGVLLLTLNRPERKNAWSIEMEEAYFDALLEASANPEVRVVVVTGSGNTFCPGMDVATLAESSAAGRPVTDLPRRPMTLARLIPKPIIAAINGACAGVGFVLACSADLRFAARNAKLSTSFARRGLPAENSLSWILPRLIGTSAATDLLISGRTFLADEAHAIGLVNHLCEPGEVVERALGYARDLSINCSPRSMAVIKQQILTDWNRDQDESRKRALALVVELRDELTEGSRSWLDKRPPRFQGVSATLTEERGYRVKPL